MTQLPEVKADSEPQTSLADLETYIAEASQVLKYFYYLSTFMT